jgi:transglutaminase-like putative cysteine protease
MIYRITHRTSFRYARPVFESFNEVRLQPVQSESQTLLDFDLSIDPPATVIAFRDYYGNAVHDFGVTFLHDELTIEATSEVLTHAGADEPLAGPRGGADESVELAALAADDAFADELAEFLGPSRYVPLEDASAGIAAELRARAQGVSALRFLETATTTVRERLEYRIGATTVHSSVAEVLEGGSGVCQDFAHLLISLCRHAGLPARYVSGYLGSVGDASASHAWVEAYVPPYGWLGVDATLGEPCTGRHVKLGVGRDYADVAVLRGTYQGGGEATLDVRVTSEEVGPAGAIAELGARADGTGRRLVAIQNLGALRQFQRGTVMLQTVGGGGHTLALEDLPPPRGQRRGEDEVPSQQPQQQQQPLDDRSPAAVVDRASRRSIGLRRTHPCS